MVHCLSAAGRGWRAGLLGCAACPTLLTAVYVISAASDGRYWPPNRWHIEWGNVSEALAAFAAASAALVALRIAGRDRRERKQERKDEQRRLARLVHLEVSTVSNRPVIEVQVRNYGPLPVADIKVVEATWRDRPEASWKTVDTSHHTPGQAADSDHRPILKPTEGLTDRFDTMAEFDIRFEHPTDGTPLIPVATPQLAVPNYVQIDLSKVEVKIQFTTADGVLWETPTKGNGTGEPVRLKN